MCFLDIFISAFHVRLEVSFTSVFLVVKNCDDGSVTAFERLKLEEVRFFFSGCATIQL